MAIKSQLKLTILEKIVDWSFSVPNIEYNDFKRTLASIDSSQFIIFDTRSPEEFKTSHITNAIQLDPGITQNEFGKIYSKRIKDKRLVFYCSVGYRSSKCLQRLKEVAHNSGAISLQNLKGGIFRWYNENYEVINEKGITDDIHPYGAFWEFLLDNRD
ncbi:rhodanese-like domain-containing protein [candidate division KSB1 bacterium]|nr:rhodanese-like domain-containing protein [candidate division KSB1 bacterium]